MGIRRKFSSCGGWPGRQEEADVLTTGGQLGIGKTAPGTFCFCVASEDELMGFAMMGRWACSLHAFGCLVGHLGWIGRARTGSAGRWLFGQGS